MRAIYFGELDSFSGTFPQERRQVGRLTRILKILCLAYDVILVPPGSLLEHGAALPVFEELAPLVRAGRLGTSADHSASSPAVYFKERIDRQSLPVGSHARAWACAATDEVRDRWLGILPNDWALRRNVQGQVGSFHELVLGELKAIGRNRFEAIANHLETGIYDVLDKGHVANRERIFMLIGSMRSELRVEELSFAATLVQRAYFHAGTSLHDVGTQPGSACVLFPGGLHRTIKGQARWGGGPHHFVVQFADGGIEEIAARARTLGIDTSAIARFSAGDLLELVEMRSWKPISRYLAGETDANPPTDEVRDRLHNRDVRDAIDGVPKDWAIGQSPSLAPALVVPTWGWAARGLLGSGFWASSPVPTADACTFDWTRRLLRSEGIAPVTLPPATAHLLTLVAISGEVGLSVEEAIQAMREYPLGGLGPDPGSKCGPTSGNERGNRIEKLRQRDSAASEAATFRNRLDVYKNALSVALRSFGIELRMHQGRIRIATGSIQILNTPWSLLGDDQSVPPDPELAGVELQVWRVMREHLPNEVGSSVILDKLGGAGRGTAYVSKIVYRIAQKLRRAGSRWQVLHDSLGNYRLTALPTRT